MKRSSQSLFGQNMPKKPNLKKAFPDYLNHLGGENFVKVGYFIGQTRVHIRRYVFDDEGELQPTKDGISLSPKVWSSLCNELSVIINHRSSEKVFVIERDLCVSKQIKDGEQIYVFQRLFQRKCLRMEFVSEHVVLTGPEMEKLSDFKCSVTETVKDGLITYSLEYFVCQELNKPGIQYNPVDDPDSFLKLLDSLRICLCAAISLKINELINCFGCHDGYPPSFMHDCLRSRSEKWSENFPQALYLVNMNDVAKDLVHQNLNINLGTVLFNEEFFDAIKISELFKSIETIYVAEENNVGEEKNVFDSLE